MDRQFLNIAAIVTAVLVLAIGGPLLVREMRSLPDTQTLAGRSGERIVTLEVGGMTCAGCAGAVMARVSALEGVSAVDVRLEQDRAYVVCDPALPDSALIAAVESAGPAFIARVVQK
jgi:copper chaperone CopZ